MKNLKNVITEEMLLFESKKYVETYEILLRANNMKAAYNYALCFYAIFLGVLNKVYSKNEIVTTMTLKELSIDVGIIYDLNDLIYSENSDKSYSSVYYCYDKAIKTSIERPNYIINQFLNLHSKLALANNISVEKNNVKKTKSLIYSIKPSLRKNETK